MKLLMVGDVFGKPGRRALAGLLPGLRVETGADLVIANGENAAAGNGITAETAEEFFRAGVDVITGGNHIWDKVEGIGLIDKDPRIIRPINYPPGAPGRGSGVFPAGGSKIAVISVLGRIFMQAVDCPFRGLDAALERLQGVTPLIVVDFHAEASSEKVALAGTWTAGSRRCLEPARMCRPRTSGFCRAEPRVRPTWA